MSSSDQAMTAEEIDVFARGLYYLAQVDGVDEREKTLIEAFLAESNSPMSWDELTSTSFQPVDAALALETSYLRRIFIKAGIALIKADGVFSDAERHAIGEIADALGLNNTEFGDLEQSAATVNL